mmetsp:Transcript_55884/g.145338  ORF Transcript_55884/g.145338 Transcript_55884/m.145338 type:complete len:291 (+) Transcript_55884:636-1508(+)
MIMTTSGNPCGMIETDMMRPCRTLPMKKHLSSSSGHGLAGFWYRTTKLVVDATNTTHTQMTPITAPSILMLFCSGLWSLLVGFSSFAMSPTCVRIPVSRTSATPLPDTTAVEEKTMLVGKAAAGSLAMTVLRTSLGSPVSTDSLVFSSTLCSTSMSAGTISPAMRCTTSPGTSSLVSTWHRAPSRITVALAAVSLVSSALASCPVYSPTALIVQTTTTMPTRQYAFRRSFMSQLRTAAQEVSRKITFLACVSKMARKLSFPAVSRTFSPNRCSRLRASALLRPRAGRVAP